MTLQVLRALLCSLNTKRLLKLDNRSVLELDLALLRTSKGSVGLATGFQPCQFIQTGPVLPQKLVGEVKRDSNGIHEEHDDGDEHDDEMLW